MKMTRPRVIAYLVLLVLSATFACDWSARPSPPPTTPLAGATPQGTAKPAQSSAPVSFAGKAVTIIVSWAPGGSTDILARLFARYMGQYLPGRPTVVVKSMPGGGGIIGANYSYAARPDGLTAMLFASTLAVHQLVGVGGVKYDLTRMPAMIGIAQGGVFYARKGVLDRPEDLPKAKGIIIGSTTGRPGFLFVATKELLNFPADKTVLAYEGAGDALRAFLSGEINVSFGATPGYIDSILPYVTRGEVLPLFQSGILDEKGSLVRESVLKDMPTMQEIYEKIYGKPPAGMAWESYRAIAALMTYDKGLLLPPGSPEGVTRAYWDAFQAMARDADFLATIERLSGKGARMVAGEGVDREFKQNLKSDPEVVKWLRTTLPKYGVVIE